MSLPASPELRTGTEHYQLIVAALALTAALIMLFGVFRSQTIVTNSGDPYRYGEIARGFVDHGFSNVTRRAASLYPEFIAVVYRLGGGNSSVEFLQGLMHVGTCLLAFALARQLYNARTALIAGVFCAVHPMLLRYVADLHMETMLTFLCTLTVWCAVRFHRDRTIANGVLLGGVGMITTLTKGVILPYLMVFGIVCLLSGFRRGGVKGLLPVVAMFLTMGVLLAPWTYRNYVVSGGRFVLLTPGASDSFLRGYIFTRLEFATLQQPPYTVAENESNAWFRQIARDAGTEWERDELIDEANNARVAKQMIRDHPLDTVRKCVVGLFTFWYEMTSLVNSLVPAVLALGGWALAIIGLQRAHREQRPSWLILLPIVVMNVFVAALIPLGRYSVPILPCLMILAAYGLDTLTSRARPGVTARAPA